MWNCLTCAYVCDNFLSRWFKAIPCCNVTGYAIMFQEVVMEQTVIDRNRERESVVKNMNISRFLVVLTYENRAFACKLLTKRISSLQNVLLLLMRFLLNTDLRQCNTQCTEWKKICFFCFLSHIHKCVVWVYTLYVIKFSVP